MYSENSLITTGIGEVLFRADPPQGEGGFIHPPVSPTGEIELPYLLAMTCGVRVPPSRTLQAGIRRIPGLAQATCVGRSFNVEPRWENSEKHLGGIENQLEFWIENLPSAHMVLDNPATLAAERLAEIANISGRTINDEEPPADIDPLDTLTDAAAMPILVGRGYNARRLAAALRPGQYVISTALIGELTSVTADEASDLVNSVAPSQRDGLEIPNAPEKGLITRFLRRRRTPHVPDHEQSANTVLLPPWFREEAQRSIHTAALASAAAWANWFDGVSGHARRVYWYISDPELDGLVVNPQVLLPIFDPSVFYAFYESPPCERGLFDAGRLIDQLPLNRGVTKPAVGDEVLLMRKSAVAWLSTNSELAQEFLSEGELARRGLIDADGLADVLDEPFARAELALPLVRTVGIESWLKNLSNADT